MEKTVQENFVFDNTVLSILNNTRNWSYDLQPCGFHTDLNPCSNQRDLAQRRWTQPTRLYAWEPVFCWPKSLLRKRGQSSGNSPAELVSPSSELYLVSFLGHGASSYHSLAWKPMFSQQTWKTLKVGSICLKADYTFFSTQAIAWCRLFETAMSNMKKYLTAKKFISIKALTRTLKISIRVFLFSWTGGVIIYQFKLLNCLIIGIYF